MCISIGEPSAQTLLCGGSLRPSTIIAEIGIKGAFFLKWKCTLAVWRAACRGSRPRRRSAPPVPAAFCARNKAGKRHRVSRATTSLTPHYREQYLILKSRLRAQRPHRAWIIFSSALGSRGGGGGSAGDRMVGRRSRGAFDAPPFKNDVATFTALRNRVS